jgi:hypothetical protein
VADHGANGPEVVVAVGGNTIEEMDPTVVRSRCWCCMGDTRFVAARLARYSTSILYLRSLRRPLLHSNPMGCAARDRVPTVTGVTATNKPGPSRNHRDVHDTIRRQVRKRRRRAPHRALDFRSVDTLAEGLAGQPPASSGDTSLPVHAAYTATASVPS